MEMPQSSVEGLWVNFFAGGGKNIPLYCNISRTEDVMGLLATRASRRCGPPPPAPPPHPTPTPKPPILEERRRQREDVAAKGRCSPISQVFFPGAPRCRRVKVITLQFKIKMSLGREPQHNSTLRDTGRVH